MTIEHATDVFPQIPWAQVPGRMQWRQGEHVTLIGTTGQGKTTLIRELVPLRDYVVVLATKQRDSALTGWDGFEDARNLTEWKPRIIARPPFPKDAHKLFAAHRAIFRDILLTAYRQGGWTIAADEVRYLTEQLDLGAELELLWLQGRSLGVSLVTATQRPRHIPLSAYDQATHLFLWRETDIGNVRRLSEIGGSVDRDAIMRRIPTLPQYQFLYVNTRTGDTFESKVDL